MLTVAATGPSTLARPPGTALVALGVRTRSSRVPTRENVGEVSNRAAQESKLPRVRLPRPTVLKLRCENVHLRTATAELAAIEPGRAWKMARAVTLLVWDWERAAADVPVGLDAVQFLFQVE